MSRKEKDLKKYLRRNFIKRLRIMLINNVEKRTEYLRKKKVFHKMGINCHFQPRKIPSDPKLISLGNNVHVASNVTFITHDIINNVFSTLDNIKYNDYIGKIEIGDNVFVGTNTIILPNIKIGSNIIIGAGSIVTNDLESNSIVVGIPAKKIGTFDNFREKRKQYLEDNNLAIDERISKLWKENDSSYGNFDF